MELSSLSFLPQMLQSLPYQKTMGFIYFPGLKVPMTAPVTTRVIPAPGPACKNNFTVSFFVPFADQDNPPMPSNDTVFISTLQEFTAYVRLVQIGVLFVCPFVYLFALLKWVETHRSLLTLCRSSPLPLFILQLHLVPMKVKC